MSELKRFVLTPNGNLEPDPNGRWLMFEDVDTELTRLLGEVERLTKQLDFVVSNFVSKNDINYIQAIAQKNTDQFTMQDFITICKKHHIDVSIKESEND